MRRMSADRARDAVNLAFASWNITNGDVDAGDDARLHRQIAVLAGLGPSARFVALAGYRDAGPGQGGGPGRRRAR